MPIFGGKGASQRDKFRKELQEVLTDKYVHGEIDRRDYRRAMRASRRNRNIEALMAKARESGQEHSDLKGDFSWEYIVEWLKENWLSVLFTLLKIALMFADSPWEKQYYEAPLKGKYKNDA